MENIKIIEIKSLEELYKIENETWQHVVSLDTIGNYKFIEYDYDQTIWLWISDEAWHRTIVKIKKETYRKDENLRLHIKYEYHWEILLG